MADDLLEEDRVGGAGDEGSDCGCGGGGGDATDNALDRVATPAAPAKEEEVLGWCKAGSEVLATSVPEDRVPIRGRGEVSVVAVAGGALFTGDLALEEEDDDDEDDSAGA